MRRKKFILIILLVLTIINIMLFVFRDRFQYQPYASYAALYAACDDACIQKWQQFKNDYPAEELQKAKQISDSVIGNTDDLSEKIVHLAGFVHNRFKKQSGKPSEALLTASPFTQYNMLCASDTVQLWCGNFAEIFSFFCWSQGIVTRNIEIYNPGDHHVLNECYLPVQKQWVMVDPTNGLLLVRDSSHLLDLQTFKKALEQQSTITYIQDLDTVNAAINRNEGFIRNYYMKENPCYYFHRVDNKKAYSFSNKIKQYFLPVSWYDIFDDKGRNNTAFYVKELFILLWLISFFVFYSWPHEI